MHNIGPISGSTVNTSVSSKTTIPTTASSVPGTPTLGSDVLEQQQESCTGKDKKIGSRSGSGKRARNMTDNERRVKEKERRTANNHRER